MSHRRRIDGAHPCCVVFLVDQSDSMTEPLAGDGSRSKAEAVADILNGTLYELVIRCVKNPHEPPRPYFAVAVLGYGTTADGESVVESLLPDDGGDLCWVPDLAENPLRVDQRRAPSGGGTVFSPVWVEPRSHGGTPMCAALDRAGALAHRWIASFPDSFPPLVINLTDGEATDGDPRTWATRLRSLSTTDGPVLLFNLSLSSVPATPVLFPASSTGLPSREAAALFEMSSLLPEIMLEGAGTLGEPVRLGARGFGCNADLKGIVTFLNIGTSVGRTPT